MNKKILALFSVLSLVVFLGAGCGDDKETKNTNTSNSNTSVVRDTTNENANEVMEDDTEEMEYGLNEEGTIGNVTYTVTGFELLKDEIPTEYHNYADTIGEPKAADEGRDWLRVEFTMTNNGNEKVSLFGSNFIVENSDGQKIESSNDVTSYIAEGMNPVLDSDIQAGASQDYIVYFDIPEGSEDLEFLAPDPAEAFNNDAPVLTFMLSEEAEEGMEDDSAKDDSDEEATTDEEDDMQEEVQENVNEIEEGLEQ